MGTSYQFVSRPAPKSLKDDLCYPEENHFFAAQRAKKLSSLRVLQHLFFVVKARIFADRAQSAPHAKPRLRSINQICHDSDQGWDRRRRSQGQHGNGGRVPLVLADLVRK